MNDLPEDQLPEEQDETNLPVVGWGNVHTKFQWIAAGLKATNKSQADLARALGWDQPTMSRQLKNKRVLGADELIAIYKFFADNGYIVGPIADITNAKLTIPAQDVSRPAGIPQVELEGKVDLSIKMLDDLRETVSDLRGRVQALERERHAEGRQDHEERSVTKRFRLCMAHIRKTMVS
jgi:hypothetical protein